MTTKARADRGIEVKSFPFVLDQKSGDTATDGTCCLEGVTACYCNIDCVGDMYVPGCFADFLPFFKSEGVVRDEHQVTTGRVADAADVKGGLWIRGEILPTTAGKDQAILVRGKAVKRLSLGARNFGRWTDDPEDVKSLWAKHGYTPTEDDLMRVAYGVRVIDRSKPYEVSTTWLPTNESTSITSVKSQAALPRPTFDQHSADVLTRLEEFAARALDLKALRSADGRGLSAKSLARVKQLETLLATLAAPLEAKAKDGAGATTGQTAIDPRAEYARFLANVARSHGCES